MINADDILKVTKSVTKKWTKQRKAEERSRRSVGCRMYTFSDRVNFTDLVHKILPKAYAHASGDGLYSVAKRQLYYACREDFRGYTGRPLGYPYFANTLLTQYLNRNPEATRSWKITADPRGTLIIPNAGHDVRIPCGTLQIEEHLLEASEAIDATSVCEGIKTRWPSLQAGQRYQGVLYIEKEGFGPVLSEARIAERFDLAILSCKGQSVVAARVFVDKVCAMGRGVPLFVVHDFDKAGFEISQRLTRVSDWARYSDRVTYEFENEINVTDLGLRLEDVEKYDLDHEEVEFKGRFARDSICTKAEKEYLISDRRVELNAFTSPQLIEWLESKLTEHGLQERLVPEDKVLEDAYRRAVIVASLNEALEDAEDAAIELAKSVKIPADLRGQLREEMQCVTQQSMSWDQVLYELVLEKVRNRDFEK